MSAIVTPPQQPQQPAVAPPKPSASIATHPLFISAEEGLPLVTQDEVLVQLNKILKLKNTAVILYMNYGDRLMAHWRDSAADHFKDHMKDERKGAYILTRKITALGGDPEPKIATIPSNADFHKMIMQIMESEKELLKEERKLIDMAGPNFGLKLLGEELFYTDNHHLDDMRRLLYCEAVP